MHKGGHTTWLFCGCTQLLCQATSELWARWTWHLLRASDGCPDSTSAWWTLSHDTLKFRPKEAKSQQRTLHDTQPSPALTAERPAARERALSMGCVCTGLIMIRRMFDFLLYPSDNRHSNPGQCLTRTRVCLLRTRRFPHQAEALFA